MLIIGIIRVLFFPDLALLQFCLNLSIVGITGVCIHKQVSFSNTGTISDYTILNKNGKKILVEENMDAKNKLQQTLVQVFFGFLIALSFFFTQVTSSTNIQDKVDNVTR